MQCCDVKGWMTYCVRGRKNPATHRHTIYTCTSLEVFKTRITILYLIVWVSDLPDCTGWTAHFQPHVHTHARAHTRVLTHTHTLSTLAENHSTCLEGLPVTTEEQKQAVNAASASVQESCHCMHCNELLITPSVWTTNAQLATPLHNCLSVCFVFSIYLWCNPSCVFVCARFICDRSEQMSADTSCWQEKRDSISQLRQQNEARRLLEEMTLFSYRVVFKRKMRGYRPAKWKTSFVTGRR